MAGGNAIEARSIDEVMNIWQMQDAPCWGIWTTNKPRPVFSCSNDDVDDRQKMLLQYLNLLKNTGTSAEYMIKYYDDQGGKKITANTPPIGSTNFKLSEQNMDIFSPAGNNAGGGGNIQLLTEVYNMKFENWKLMQEMEQLQRDRDMEDVEEADDDSTMGKIGRVVDMVGEAGERYPWMQNILNKLADSITDVFTVVKHKAGNSFGKENTAHMAGIQDAVMPEMATDVKESIDNSIATLCDFYINNTAQHIKAKHPTATTEEVHAAATTHGTKELAADLRILAGLTNDPDMFFLAIKKLRANA